MTPVALGGSNSSGSQQQLWRGKAGTGTARAPGNRVGGSSGAVEALSGTGGRPAVSGAAAMATAEEKVMAEGKATAVHRQILAA
jgi:hypothetical protein